MDTMTARANTNLARMRFWGGGDNAGSLVCEECREVVVSLDNGTRMDIALSYARDHERECEGHPSGVHYMDRG